MDKPSLMDLLSNNSDEEIITPELEKRFASLPNEEQEKVISLFHDRSAPAIKDLIEKSDEEDAQTTYKSITQILRNTLTTAMDEVEKKRRGLYLL